jgi:hypothetical protein
LADANWFPPAAALEFVPNHDRISKPMPAAFSLTMLMTTAAGDADTFRELSAMYTDAGFGEARAHPIPMSPETIVMDRPETRDQPTR